MDLPGTTRDLHPALCRRILKKQLRAHLRQVFNHILVFSYKIQLTVVSAAISGPFEYRNSPLTGCCPNIFQRSLNGFIQETLCGSATP
jgi:hypothetical protein